MPAFASVVTPDERFLLRTRSNSAKTIIDPTTATEAATRIRKTSTINPLKIAIRFHLPDGLLKPGTMSALDIAMHGE